ncbi:MAG: glycyl radical protein, partial [Clostridia bacterium]|nr:glycyl radical protein [Clostridia bacterium]
PRSCQTFPEFSYEWLESEFDTVETRSADPFYISEETKARLKEANAYWKGKTTSELATEYMTPETRLAIEHNFFTPGNYFYNGVGHVTVDYGKVLGIGLKGIKAEAENELKKCRVTDGNYQKKSAFLTAVIISLDAVMAYAMRYSVLAKELAEKETDPTRKQELIKISENCRNVPANSASSFYEACQSFWFIQMLIQMESSGHSISPGRFDQYMYPYYKKDIDANKLTLEFAQELMDCVWVKLNDLSKCRDAASAEGFAGYSMFQNLICGGQDSHGTDVTNDLSFMCIEASMHVMLPAPSLSIRVWNLTPHELMIKAAELTRTGIGLPAYYNDEVIIPALISRGLSLEDARDYNIIGCVEPQKSGKTEGWHDAAFFNMLRPLEMVFSQGIDKGVRVAPETQPVTSMTSFDELFNAYKIQSDYMVGLLVNADNAIDVAHAERAPLPFLSSMVDDCIKRGKSVQEGGAVYNFTGPQGFGIANMTDALWAIKKLVFEEKKYTLEDFKNAVENNFGKDMDSATAQKLTAQVVVELHKKGAVPNNDEIVEIFNKVKANPASDGQKAFFDKMLQDIEGIDKYGNDKKEIDAFAREIAYVYTREMEKFENPRGGKFQAGLYPVSANVPLGAQTGATPDGRLAFTPIADGVSPAAGRDISGPTAAANSVSRLDHFIASNGTLYNMKFHPSALKGRAGLESFVSLVRGYFDQKGSHMQFNVVSRETLLDAQKHPENYKSLVVRVAGYSALFTTLSRSLQDDIINRTEQGGF